MSIKTSAQNLVMKVLLPKKNNKTNHALNYDALFDFIK